MSRDITRHSQRLPRDIRGLARDSRGMARESPGLAHDSPVLTRDSPRLTLDSPGLARDSPAIAFDVRPETLHTERATASSCRCSSALHPSRIHVRQRSEDAQKRNRTHSNRWCCLVRSILARQYLHGILRHHRIHPQRARGRYECRATASLLEISQDLLRQRVVEVIGHRERSCSQTVRPWAADKPDRPDLGHGPIVIRHDQGLSFTNAIQYGVRISLHILDADVHPAKQSSKRRRWRRRSYGGAAGRTTSTPPNPPPGWRRTA